MSSIKSPQKNGLKNALFQPVFFSFFASKPLHIVVDLPYLPFKPQFVIRTILSTCLERSIKMPLEPGGALAAGWIFESQACCRPNFCRIKDFCCTTL